MIFLKDARLVILSQPKTGTTALDQALKARSTDLAALTSVGKPVTYRKFLETVAPEIFDAFGLRREEYDVVSVMREPIDWLGSWYRFRARRRLARKRGNHADRYTGDISFDEFVLNVCRDDDRPAYARVGMPHGIAVGEGGVIGVDRLFPYEDLSGLYELLAKRIGEPVSTQRRNVSPFVPMKLSQEAMERAKVKFAYALKLHASLTRDGAVDPEFRRVAGCVT